MASNEEIPLIPMNNRGEADNGDPPQVQPHQQQNEGGEAHAGDPLQNQLQQQGEAGENVGPQGNQEVLDRANPPEAQGRQGDQVVQESSDPSDIPEGFQGLRRSMQENWRMNFSIIATSLVVGAIISHLGHCWFQSPEMTNVILEAYAKLNATQRVNYIHNFNAMADSMQIDIKLSIPPADHLKKKYSESDFQRLMKEAVDSAVLEGRRSERALKGSNNCPGTDVLWQTLCKASRDMQSAVAKKDLAMVKNIIIHVIQEFVAQGAGGATLYGGGLELVHNGLKLSAGKFLILDRSKLWSLGYEPISSPGFNTTHANITGFVVSDLPVELYEEFPILPTTILGRRSRQGYPVAYRLSDADLNELPSGCAGFGRISEKYSFLNTHAPHGYVLVLPPTFQCLVETQTQILARLPPATSGPAKIYRVNLIGNEGNGWSAPADYQLTPEQQAIFESVEWPLHILPAQDQGLFHEIQANFWNGN